MRDRRPVLPYPACVHAVTSRGSPMHPSLTPPRRGRPTALLTTALKLVLLAPPAATAAHPVPHPRAATHALEPSAAAAASDRLIVRYRSGTSAAARAKTRLTATASLDRSLRLIDADVVEPAAADRA